MPGEVFGIGAAATQQGGHGVKRRALRRAASLSQPGNVDHGRVPLAGGAGNAMEGDIIVSSIATEPSAAGVVVFIGGSIQLQSWRGDGYGGAWNGKA